MSRAGVRTGGPPAEGAAPHQPPLPLPSGTTRHAAAYHPCQPSPPGNVAAFSATPSGVPVAPRHTAAGGGGGSGAGAHPGARRKRQVPLPQRPLRLRWGRGWGKGGGRCSRARGGARACERASIPTAGVGGPWAVPPASSPSTAPARSSGLAGSPLCPPHPPTPPETSLSSPVHPAREAPGDPRLAAAGAWTSGPVGLTHLLPRPAMVAQQAFLTRATYLPVLLGVRGGWPAVLPSEGQNRGGHFQIHYE